MEKEFLLGVGLLLATYGCAVLLQKAVLGLLAPLRPISGAYVLPLCGHCAQAEYWVRSLLRRLPCRIVIWDRGVDADTRAVLGRLAEQLDRVSLCRGNELEEVGIAVGQETTEAARVPRV